VYESAALCGYATKVTSVQAFLEDFSMIFLNYAMCGIPLTMPDATLPNVERHVGPCL
jgi:hypothetical protein